MEILVLRVELPGPRPFRLVIGKILKGEEHVACTGVLLRMQRHEEDEPSYLFQCRSCGVSRRLSAGTRVAEIFKLEEWLDAQTGTLRSPLDQATRRIARQEVGHDRGA